MFTEVHTYTVCRCKKVDVAICKMSESRQVGTKICILMLVLDALLTGGMVTPVLTLFPGTFNQICLWAFGFSDISVFNLGLQV